MAQGTEVTNRQFRLASRPTGRATRDNGSLVEEPVPSADDGRFVVQVQYISLDPAMRGWMNDRRSYVPPVQIDEVMRALGVGRVIESKHPEFSEGDHVVGLFGVQE